jgi:hypothetical protein
VDGASNLGRPRGGGIEIGSTEARGAVDGVVNTTAKFGADLMTAWWRLWTTRRTRGGHAEVELESDQRR